MLRLAQAGLTVPAVASRGLSELLGGTGRGSCVRVVKALQIPVPAFIVQLLLGEATAGVFRDRAQPERSRWLVQCYLTNFPLPAVLIKDEVGTASANAEAAVLLHHEELTHPELVVGKAYVRIDQPETSVLAIHQEEVGLQFRIAQVALHTNVAKLTMFVQVLWPELSHVVLVELQHLAQYDLVLPPSDTESDFGHEKQK